MSGYKVVPVDPTPEMIQAFKAMWSLGFCDNRMAQECYAAIMDAAPAVQGEPVEYQCHSCRKTTPPPAPFKAYVECGECGALTAAPIAVRLAAPQPAEQAPAPDVAGQYLETFLVISDYLDIDLESARTASGKPSDVFISAVKRKHSKDAAGLVEALEGILAVAERVDSWESFPSDPIEIAETALAAHRKQEST